jgi:hypothetical protein
MHSVVQAAPGVWQFLTKSRATAETDMPVCLAGQILAQDPGTPMAPDSAGARRVAGVGMGISTR